MEKAAALRQARGYGFVTVICAVFGGVYELFSHGIYSCYMIYAFGVPLVLGCLLFLCIGMSKLPQPSRITLNLWNSGVAALTVGCLFKGVLEIYGTTNRLTLVYPIVGAFFLVSGALCYILKK